MRKQLKFPKKLLNRHSSWLHIEGIVSHPFVAAKRAEALQIQNYGIQLKNLDQATLKRMVI